METSADRERKQVSRELTRLLQAHGARFTLRYAVVMNDLTTTRAMLDAGANIDAHKATQTVTGLSYDNTPLQEAVGRGYLEEARLLLDRGANVNVYSKGNPPPLVTAFEHKNPELVKLLLAHRADVNLLLPDNGTDNPAVFSANNLPALALAIDYQPEFVPELLRKGADVNAKNGAVLKAAIGRHDIPLIRELLKRGGEVNPPLPIRRGRPMPFTVDARPPNHGIRDPAANVGGVFVPHNIDGQIAPLVDKGWMAPFSPLITAVCYAPECEALLLRAGAKIGPDKGSILPAAILSEHAEMLPHLLTLGADVNGTDKNGETALSLAVVHAPASVKFLLEHGANPNIVTRSTPSRTPLSQAAISGATECARLLMAHHADVNLRPAQGHTPLYYANKHNHADVAALLQQAGGKDE